MKSRILIIEDNIESIYLLSFLLRNGDYEIMEANDGLDGYNKARKYHPDIILLDVQLPVMNGYEVAAGLRKDETMKNIPIIILTSYATQSDNVKVTEAGANGYIAKPIDTELFISQMVSLEQAFHEGLRA